MKIEIENYRGFDIEFDTHAEVFQCIITDGMEKESRSFSAVKGFIDNYIKNNQNFQPFYVITAPQARMFRKRVRLKIVGVRKDGRLVGIAENGEKRQISDYDLRRYMLEDETNKKYLDLLDQYDTEKREFEKAYSEKVELAYEKMSIITLEMHKEKLLK